MHFFSFFPSVIEYRFLLGHLNARHSPCALSIGFKKTMVDALKVTGDKEDWGLFIDSCFTHCQTLSDVSWNSAVSPRLGNKVASSKIHRKIMLYVLPFFFFAPTIDWIDIYISIFSNHNSASWSRPFQRLLEIGTMEGESKRLTVIIRATQHATVYCLYDPLLLNWNASDIYLC
jgi:hypothetical protein